MSFTFVRHPFVRLVSTYQNKVVDGNHALWRKKIRERSSVLRGIIACEEMLKSWMKMLYF